MKKLYSTKEGVLGVLDEQTERIYWVEEDLSPIWSNYIHGQKSMFFNGIEKELDFICELGFDYVHVTDLNLNASLD